MAKRRMLAPIISKKHFVHQSIMSIAASSITNLVLLDSVPAPANASTAQVEEGSVVKAIHIEMWYVGLGGQTSPASFNSTLEKLPANVGFMTFAQAANLMSYPNKKNILYTTQGAISQADAGPAIPLFKAWYKIPKGKQRMGLDDKIVLNIANLATVTYQVCGISIYKEYQ